MVALSALPASWDKLTARGLAEHLAESLVSTLHADVVYVRVNTAEDEVLEALDTSETGLTEDQAAVMCAALAPRAVPSTPGPLSAVPGLGNGELRVTSAPISFDGGLGAVIAASARPDFPARGERVLLSFAANQAAIAFARRRAEDDRLRLLARDERRAAQFQALMQAALLIGRNPAVDDLVQQVTEEARSIIGAHQAMTALSATGMAGDLTEGLSVSSKYKAWTESPESETLSAPLIGRTGQNLGTIRLADKVEGYFTPDDQAVLIHLAHLAAVAIENARLFHELEDQMDAHVQLNGALGQALDDRDAAVAEIRQALRTREEFLSSAAHDLRTPIASVKGMAQVLKRRADRNWPNGDVIAEGLGDIDRTADHMVDLIDELLDLARLRSDRPLELHLKQGDLVAMAAEAVRARENVSRVHQVRLETELSELTGAWDTARLLRVLNNLLENAVKYSPKGGEVLVTVAREDECAVLSVRDCGIGIPAQDLTHLFERFYRGTNVVGVVPGTGIGLTGARYIVESHGGTIHVESAEGQGSTFTVRLPLT